MRSFTGKSQTKTLLKVNKLFTYLAFCFGFARAYRTVLRENWPIRDALYRLQTQAIKCKTCPFIYNVEKLSGPKRSIKITDHFTCTSANVIYCTTCTLCKKVYIGETGRRLGDRFREHLRDVEKDDKDASKPVARHFNLPNHSMQHMAVCGLSLHQGSTESRKTLEQRFIFQIGTLNPHGINELFSFNYRIYSNKRRPRLSAALE